MPVSKELLDELKQLVREAEEYCKIPMSPLLEKDEKQPAGTRRWYIDGLVSNNKRDLYSMDEDPEIWDEEEIESRIDRLTSYKEKSKNWTI
jgi:hypothetical protein